ncbi:MAG: hypothetical protein KGL39_14900 [Patescibacteria group bacterium]|nr:hypothetical protein [Patescibacteria group bacterium]
MDQFKDIVNGTKPCNVCGGSGIVLLESPKSDQTGMTQTEMKCDCQLKAEGDFEDFSGATEGDR